MSTALVLVNRVLRQLNLGDVATFSDMQSKRVLDHLNGAVDTLMTQFDWDCDLRHDGVLRTFADQEVASVLVTNGSLLVGRIGDTVLYAVVQDAATKRAVMRVQVEDDAAYGSTAYRADIGFQNTTTGISKVAIDQLYPGTTGTVTLRCLANEYAMPTTVRRVLSVRHQETDVRLEAWNRNQLFDRCVQAPGDTVSDQPTLVMIAGRCEPTQDAGSATADPSADPSDEVTTSLVIYPTPDSEYRLDYSYYYKHAELSATTDTLANVDRAIEDLIVQLAYARCVTAGIDGTKDEKSLAGGLALEERAMNLARRLHANQRRDPGRRYVLGSNFARGYARPDLGTFPRHFGTGT